MFGIDFTFFWTAVNLAVLYLVVNKFLFKKLSSFMDRRSESIAIDIEKGEAARIEGEHFKHMQEEALSEIRLEREKIIEDARKMASEEYDMIIRNAKSEAERIIKKAADEAAFADESYKTALRREVSELTLLAASKIIGANMDNERNRALVDLFLASEEAA